jgi:hypothetical protein
MSGEGDKRKVSTDALETLGNIIGPEEKRDAIHLAVEPVIAQEILYPGQNVGADGTTNNPVGIVDPFLKVPRVYPGERFWLVVYPRQINSLRHVWSHPAFPDEEESPTLSSKKKDLDDDLPPFDAAILWIEKYAHELGLNYEELMAGADDWLRDEDYLSRGELLEGNWTSPDFWTNYEIVRKTKVVVEKKQNFFSCSC